MRAAIEAFTAAGSPQHRLWVEVHCALDLSLLGAYEEAERLLAGALREPGSGAELRLVASVAMYTLAGIRAAEGRLDEARFEVSRMIAAEHALGNAYLEGLGRVTLARVFRKMKDLASASAEANAAIALLSMVPFDHAMACAELAMARLAEGQHAEALALSRDAYRRVLATPGYGEAAVRLAHAEALLASGAAAEARAVLAEACRRLPAREPHDRRRLPRPAVLRPDRGAPQLRRMPRHARQGLHPAGLGRAGR